VNPSLQKVKSDLHVHTVVSPCAEVEMIPPLIVESALEKRIDLIAITDHNSTRNYEAVKKAAEGTALNVLPGMELQTREDVHVLCLFDTTQQVYEFQSVVDQHLPDITNKPDFFGEQFVVDESGEFICREERLLLTAASLSLTDAFKLVEDLGGLFIPAHVNRKAFGLLEVLGFVPTDVAIPAVEVSKHVTPTGALQRFPQLQGYPIIQNGDVHRLDEFLGATTFYINEISVNEIKLALKNAENRYFEVAL
jgi:PHP family Zn ribbon phosphoesterase